MRKIIGIFCAVLMGILLIPFSTATSYGVQGEGLIVDHQEANLETLEALDSQNIQKAKQLNIVYWHTSHGSQITSGIYALPEGLMERPDFNSNLYTGLNIDEPQSTDLGNSGWPNITRNYLDQHPETHVVMWSWCGQVTNMNEAGINTYLNNMSTLEEEYPEVTFVYMTGHLPSNGSVAGDNTDLRNTQIRNYCTSNGKVLFDFADIETFDLEGNSYLNQMGNDHCDYDSDGDGQIDSNWAEEYQNSHEIGMDWYNCYSAHSKPLNANRKAYAAWYMFSKIAEQTVIGGDMPEMVIHDFSDTLTALTEGSFQATATVVNIEPGVELDVIWNGGMKTTGVPTPQGLDIEVSPVSANGQVTLTVTSTDQIQAGEYPFVLTLDGEFFSNEKTIVVEKKEQSPLSLLDWQEEVAMEESFFAQLEGGNGTGEYVVEAIEGCNAFFDDGGIFVEPQGETYRVRYMRQGDDNYLATPWYEAEGTVVMDVEEGWVQDENGWRFYQDGEFLTDGLYPIDGDFYLFDKMGYRIEDAFVELEGDVYCFDEDGKMLFGLHEVDGDTYYFDEETGVMAQSTFVNVGGKRYYFGSAGAAPTLLGFGYVGTDKYYFNGDGSVALGLKVIDGKTYYFDQNTGVMAKSTFMNVDGKRYYFGSTGAAPTLTGFGYVGADKYYFNGDGSVSRGLQVIDGKTYYFDEETGVMAKSTFINVDGKRYYFGSDGAAPTLIGISYVGQSRYYFLGDGSVALGLSIFNGDTYYFGQATGVMAYSTFKNVGGERYYLGSNGIAPKLLGFGYVGVHKYYFNGNGSVSLGLKVIGDKTYYFNQNTGVMAQSTFMNVDGKRYYFGSMGAAPTLTGFAYVGSDRYYFNGDGSVALGIKVIDGKTYYFDQNTGIMAKSTFINVDGKRYYFMATGAAPTLTGLAYVGSDQYYFNGDGTVFRGEKIMNGYVYTFHMQTGVLLSVVELEGGL